MRQFIIHSIAALFVILACCFGTLWAADSPAKPRYPALAYVAAGLIILIVVTIVAFPSRKETWDQGVEDRRRARKNGKRKREEYSL
jgi:hypothetical protein